jgi:hypothetical protein
MASLFLRPALVGASVVVLGLGGLGAWSMMTNDNASQISHESTAPAVSPVYGLDVRNPRSVAHPGELIPVDGMDAEARRLQERYLEASQYPRDYVMEGVRLEEVRFDS